MNIFIHRLFFIETYDEIKVYYTYDHGHFVFGEGGGGTGAGFKALKATSPAFRGP